MTEHDQTEYAYKNGYEKACEDILGRLDTEMRRKPLTALDEFGWGKRKGLEKAAEITKELMEAKKC